MNFIKYLNTTQWKKQGLSTEPIGMKKNETHSWIHLDVRSLELLI